MTDDSQGRILECFAGALDRSGVYETPYRHWFLDGVFPDDILAELQSLTFPVGDLGGVSGKRELHNDTRHYFDQENIARHKAVAEVANAFQSAPMVKRIEDFFSVDLEGTFLRLEYAQDVDGFWLEPHTDLGVKRLTVLIYLSDGPQHGDLGTDIFTAEKQPIKRSPFKPNFAMAFVPGGNTYHGFQRREINGVRKSVILNYVTTDWRDREQLSFPDATVSAG